MLMEKLKCECCGEQGLFEFENTGEYYCAFCLITKMADKD